MVDKNTHAHSFKSRTCFQLIRTYVVCLNRFNFLTANCKLQTANSKLKSATFYAWKHFVLFFFSLFYSFCFHACGNGFLFRSHQTFIIVMCECWIIISSIIISNWLQCGRRFNYFWCNSVHSVRWLEQCSHTHTQTEYQQIAQKRNRA